MADALLDKQYWAPDDPQKHPYDDTGWSFTQLFNVKAVRLTDAAILKAPMTPVVDFDQASGKISGSGSIYAIANTGQTSLLPLVYALKQAHVETTEKAFDAEGKHFGAGSLVITQADESSLTADAAQAFAGCDASECGAFGGYTCCGCAANRVYAYVARHPDRGLVAAGVR